MRSGQDDNQRLRWDPRSGPGCGLRPWAWHCPRLGLITPFLAVGRGRLRGGVRGLVRTLQPQHQLNQFLAAQTLQIAATHPPRESAKSVPRKKPGAFAEHRRDHPRRTCKRTTWAITTGQGLLSQSGDELAWRAVAKRAMWLKLVVTGKPSRKLTKGVLGIRHVKQR